MLLGVDGCREGWIVALDDEDDSVEVRLFRAMREVTDLDSASLVVVDVPIGLPSTGARECDRQARTMLGPRRSSVFPAPLRSMLSAADWEGACQIRYAAEGKRCSRQVFSIINKIREVDELMSPARQAQVLEGHPEVSFAALSRRPLRWSKRRSAGRLERLTLLQPVFPEVDSWLARFRGFSSDVIDAFACLWTARRVRKGNALHLPPAQAFDEKGLRMEIVA